MIDSTDKGKDNLGEYPALKKLHDLAEKNLLADDDHLDRKDSYHFSEQELKQAVEEMKRKFGVKSNINIVATISEEEKKRITTLTDNIITRLTNEIELWKKSIIDSFTLYNWDESAYNTISVFMKVRLSMLDITILFKQVFKAEAEVEQNLYARLLCGQLFEFAEDVPEMLGKNFRNTISKIPQHEVLMSELNRLMKEFHSKKVKFSSVIKNVRHNVSSHKDIDGLKQIYFIQELDFQTIIYAFLEINNWYCELAGYELKFADEGAK